MLTRKIQGDSILFYKDDALILTIDETEDNDRVILSLKGDLLSDAAHPLQDELDAFTTVGTKLILDFKDVAYAAPSIFVALLNVQQLIDFFRHGEILLKNIPADLYHEMDEIGITELLMIEN